jgi:Protein of unknown function (DUF3106)
MIDKRLQPDQRPVTADLNPRAWLPKPAFAHTWRKRALAALTLCMGVALAAQPNADPALNTDPATAPAGPATTSVPATAAAASGANPHSPVIAVMGSNVQATTASGAAPPANPTPASAAWQSLSRRQKLALAPLAREWHELSAQQRQKWLALSKNFSQISDEEQLTLHSRMREWAALSPRQRSQARFHFNTTQAISAQDKRAQWEAYQALTEQEKRKLSSGPKPPAKSGARSFAPPSARLVSPPLLPVNATRAVQRVAPSKPIHPKTLLPQPS